MQTNGPPLLVFFTTEIISQIYLFVTTPTRAKGYKNQGFNPRNPIIRSIRNADEWAAFVGVFHHRNNKPDLLVGDNTNKGKRV